MARFGGSTVYDRMKKTGYITGPKHTMLGQEAAAPVPPDAGGDPGGSALDEPGTEGSDETGDVGPPNLRDAKDVADACGDCVHFDGGQCTKFNTNVTPNQVCDEFQEGAPDNGEETGTPEVPEGPVSQTRP
jgi:hypothetical protein